MSVNDEIQSNYVAFFYYFMSAIVGGIGGLTFYMLSTDEAKIRTRIAILTALLAMVLAYVTAPIFYKMTGDYQIASSLGSLMGISGMPGLKKIIATLWVVIDHVVSSFTKGRNND